MCTARTKPSLYGTLGDLVPGTEFHLPNGDRFMTLDPTGLGRHILTLPTGEVPVANLRTGQITPMYADVKLALDERGRPYASTALNGWYDPTPVLVADDTAKIDPPAFPAETDAFGG